MSKLLISLAVFIFSCHSFGDEYDELFFGSEEQTRFIVPYLDFVEGADVGFFREIYQKGFSRLMEERKSMVEDLLYAGAYGDEVLKLMEYIENSTKRTRKEAKKNLDTVLLNIKSRLTALHEYYRPTGRALIFRHASKEVRLKSLQGDFFIYGTYHIDRGDLYVDLNIVNLKTLVERSFSAAGQPREVGVHLANQLFHHFHKTRFPTTLRIGSKKIEMIEHGTIHAPARQAINSMYFSAKDICEYQGAKLISKRDFDVVRARGIYQGGVSMGTSTMKPNYLWAVDYNRVFRPNFYSPINLERAYSLDYICVK